MKFLHLSDLHIGIRLLNRDLSEDQSYILGQICEIAAREKPDAVVIAGDIYDRAVPSAEAVELFDSFLSNLTAAVPEAVIMMISGNHDSAARLDCYRGILRHQNVYMIGQPPRREDEKVEKVTLTDAFGPVNFYLLPFVRPSMVRRMTGTDEDGSTLSWEEALRRIVEGLDCDPSERNVLVSHQFYIPAGKRAEDVERTDSEVCMVGNLDSVRADILEGFDYAALGHLHKPSRVGNDRIRYCGSPMAYSVSEAGQQKMALLVDLGEKEGMASVTEIPLKALREVRVIRGELEDVLKLANSDYTTVILTDRDDLDAADMQERIHAAFPYLLEIRREGIRQADYWAADAADDRMDPFELCCAFLGDPDPESRELLRDVINTVLGEDSI